MIISLGHRIADPVTLQVFAVGLDDTSIYVGMRILQPGSQGRAEIKIDSIKIASFCVRAVAFRGDLFVKIGKWSRGGFDCNLSRKRVVTRRLIKMPVQTQVCRAGLLLCFVYFS